MVILPHYYRSTLRFPSTSPMTSTSRRGQIFDESSNPDVHLYFASYDDIDDLCQVINWAYRGKPSASTPGERYSGWISEQHLLTGARITPEELKQLIDDEQHCVILVAKLKTPSGPKIVGCQKITVYDKSLQMGDEEKKDAAVEFGLNAVDPDYQSRGIGNLLNRGCLVSEASVVNVASIESVIPICFSVLQRNISMYNVFTLILYRVNKIKWNGFFDKDIPIPEGFCRFYSETDSKQKWTRVKLNLLF